MAQAHETPEASDARAGYDPLPLRRPGLAALLAWLVPGLGHWYQGRLGKAVLYFVCIMGLFVSGCYLGDWQVVYFRWNNKEWRWHYLAQAGMGTVVLPAFFQRPDADPLKERKFDETLDQLHRQRGKRMDIALVYTMIAGLLNILVIYDAFAGPAAYEEERRLLRPRLPKTEPASDPTPPGQPTQAQGVPA